MIELIEKFVTIFKPKGEQLKQKSDGFPVSAFTQNLIDTRPFGENIPYEERPLPEGVVPTVIQKTNIPIWIQRVDEEKKKRPVFTPPPDKNTS